MQYNSFNQCQDGIYTAKRIFPMSFYQQLINSIDSLIRCKGVYSDDSYLLTFDDLDEDEQGELVTLALEADDRDTYECFHQADKYAKDDDISCALVKLLKSNTPDNREYFAEEVRKQSINRYRNYLENLIDERCGWVTYDYQQSKGFDE